MPSALSRASITTWSAPASSQSLALLDQAPDDVGGEGALVLLAKLELDLQPALVGHCDHLPGRQRHVGEALSGFDPGDADVRDQVEIERQLALLHGYLERAAPGHGRNAVVPARGHLPPGHVLAANLPARHGDLHGLHQVAALREVAFEGERVVSGIERAGGGRDAGTPIFAR